MGLWALDERRDRLERAKAEGLEEGREQGREQGRKEGRTTAVNEYEDKLAAARERARAEGVDLDKYLNL